MAPGLDLSAPAELRALIPRAGGRVLRLPGSPKKSARELRPGPSPRAKRWPTVRRGSGRRSVGPLPDCGLRESPGKISRDRSNQVPLSCQQHGVPAERRGFVRRRRRAPGMPHVPPARSGDRPWPPSEPCRLVGLDEDAVQHGALAAKDSEIGRRKPSTRMSSPSRASRRASHRLRRALARNRAGPLGSADVSGLRLRHEVQTAAATRKAPDSFVTSSLRTDACSLSWISRPATRPGRVRRDSTSGMPSRAACHGPGVA